MKEHKIGFIFKNLSFINIKSNPAWFHPRYTVGRHSEEKEFGSY